MFNGIQGYKDIANVGFQEYGHIKSTPAENLKYVVDLCLALEMDTRKFIYHKI